MALRTFHPCQFHFKTTNIRRVGHVLDGGTALSGLKDEIETDGGGYLQADFSNGFTRTKTEGNAWRVITDADAGDKFNVLLCAERLYQPVGSLRRVSHSDGAPFDDATLYASSGAEYTCASDAALRATSMFIQGSSELALIGGELMSFQHATWGWRAYRLRSVSPGDGGFHVTFRSPLREPVLSGTPAEFDAPRCQMTLVSASADNSTDIGRFGSCVASFVEDMTPP